MNIYTIVLFLHVSGAIGVFAGVGIWLFGLSALRRARRVEQVRAVAWLIIVTIPFMVLSLVLLGVAGLDMAISTWGLQTPLDCRFAGQPGAFRTHQYICPGSSDAHALCKGRRGARWPAPR